MPLEKNKIQHPNWIILGFTLVLGLLALFLLGTTGKVSAAPPQENHARGNKCTDCHTEPDRTLTLESGETLFTTIDMDIFAESAHGEADLACEDCHTDSGLRHFPHRGESPKNLRDFSLEMYESCAECHQEEYDKTIDSMHGQALVAGDNHAAICTDCHNPHEQHRLTNEETGELLPEARLHIPETCARCHSTIYDVYTESVHGAALTQEGNLDVPTCIDCHGVHDIGDPTTAEYRLQSPKICADCHSESERMDKYGISTNIFDTYLADFHGTSVLLFEQKSPDQEVNKPVCFDCHGVHDIYSPDNPEHGLAIKENLLDTCQQCHPDVTSNFSDAWMSHYVPDPEHFPIVYFVDLFYKILIPFVIGGMLIFVGSDIFRRLSDKLKNGAKS